ncbi:tRNA methyltransferase [Lipomyces arxii]|uniref:tRNA methyltransferase n=1 Tax=Lipomyces arxii TaxID=56418 RepID=UPI0034CE01F3
MKIFRILRLVTKMDKFVHLKEGKATVLFENENQVFYNPVQQFNRDLSCCAIRAWSEEYAASRKVRKRTSNGDVRPFITILEALSATGLRALRYALEIPYVKSVLANDFSPSAVAAIERNIKHNSASRLVTASQGDANSVMYAHKQAPFNVIDLDPYGTAAPFIDAAVQAVSDGGLLLITCTDLSILAGTGYPEKCFANYGGFTTRTEFSHESALRLVISTIATSAARYGKAVEPLLSLSIDFYVRVFVRIKNSPLQVKSLASNTMMTYTCSGCGSTTCQPIGKTSQTDAGAVKHGFAQAPTVPPHCTHCGSVHHLGGPMWAGPLHDKSFISKILTLIESPDSLDTDVYKTIPRIKAMLTLANEEIDIPFYFTSSHISSIMRCSCPPLTTLTSALLNAGYAVSPTHAAPGAIKTTAPWEVVWDVLREWIKTNPVKLENIKQGSPAHTLLLKTEPSFKVDFSPHPDANPPSRKIKLSRYPQNPPNWGPKARAKGDTKAKSDKSS